MFFLAFSLVSYLVFSQVFSLVFSPVFVFVLPPKESMLHDCLAVSFTQLRRSEVCVQSTPGVWQTELHAAYKCLASKEKDSFMSVWIFSTFKDLNSRIHILNFTLVELSSVYMSGCKSALADHTGITQEFPKLLFASRINQIDRLTSDLTKFQKDDFIACVRDGLDVLG